MNIINKKTDLYLINFPIIFPLIYGVLLYSFPKIETLIILFTILILAEPHFGATWPFFLQKQNKTYIKENREFFIILPIVVVIYCLVGFLFFRNFFLLTFFAANIFHVTRQSIGISKLYSENQSNFKFQELLIYLFNFLFFIIGYLRFYLNLDFVDFYILELNIIVLSLIFLMNVIHYFRYKNFRDSLTFFTGMIIFYPICFVDNPVHSILMGVTMHYSQYLVLTHKIVNVRDKLDNISTNNIINFKFLKIILIYSLIMTALSYMAKVNIVWLTYLLIIPITGQMLHFYLDSQLWKFSKSHNRENVLKPLKSDI